MLHLMEKPISQSVQYPKEKLNLALKIITQVTTPETIILLSQEKETYPPQQLDFFIATSPLTNEERRYMTDKVENQCESKGIPINAILHTTVQLRNMIMQKPYFNTFLRKEGIILCNSGDLTFPEYAVAADWLALQGKQFLNRWTRLAEAFFKNAVFNYGEEDYSMATFMLHQTMEHAYSAIYLVFTGYLPNLHNLSRLRRYTRRFSSLPQLIFNDRKPADCHLYALLKNAYVNARYSESYLVTKKECATLISRVRKILMITHYICRRKIDGFNC